MDVIALAQAGFENVVAPLGTALTENQLELLWRMTGEPVLCFDGDQAGLKAAWRAADMALPMIQAGRTVRFALSAGRQGSRRSGQGRRAGRVPAPCLPRRGRSPTCCGCAKPPAACSTRRNGGPNWKRRCASWPAASATRACATTTSRKCASGCSPSSARTRSRPARRAEASATGASGQGPAADSARGGMAAGAARGLRKPGALGAGQARRRRHAAARGGDRRGAGQPSGADRREFRHRSNASTSSIPTCGDCTRR